MRKHPPMPDDVLDEVNRLALACLSGEADPRDVERLDQLVCQSDDACRAYVRLMFDYQNLRQWAEGEGEKDKADGGTGRTETDGARAQWTVDSGEGSEFRVQGAGNAGANPPSFLPPPPSFINPEIPNPPSAIRHPPSFFSLEHPIGYYAFSYGVSGLALCLLLFIFSLMSSPGHHGGSLAGGGVGGGADSRPSAEPVEPAPPEAAPEPPLSAVARITGMIDCEWSDDRAAPAHPFVQTNDKYALTSGLMEITYHTGAKVILQGPCTYEVDSSSSGFLSRGKLTARVETAKPQAAKTEDSNLQSPIPNPLFAVRTPTAVVTDLGTEFGVEVDEAGGSRAVVFQGVVELRVLGPGGDNAPPIRLAVEESARIEAGGVRLVRLTREAAEPASFARSMTLPPAFKFFNTGMGLKAAEPDPHWLCLARGGDKSAAPRPAVVVPNERLLAPANDPTHSQAIAPGAGIQALSAGEALTFRTTFEAVVPRREKAALEVNFAAEPRVVAMRCNGRDVPLPCRNRAAPPDAFFRTAIFGDLVERSNVLEIDVAADAAAPALRVEFREIPRALARAALGGAEPAPSVVDVAGFYENPNGSIGPLNTANMTADAAFGWLTRACSIPVLTNGFTFTLDSGNGNKIEFSGPISGPGGLVLVGRYEIGIEHWNQEELWLSGPDANTYAGPTTLKRGTLNLNKPDGVDAVPGDLNITGDNESPFGQIIWNGAGNQINDKANVAFVGKAKGKLVLNGHSETFNSLTLTEGSSVDTGDGGVLTVNALTVNGRPQAPGRYDSSHPFVAGTGYILVLPERRPRP